MQDFFSAVLKDNSVKEMSDCFQRKTGEAFIYGIAGSQKYVCLAACIMEKRQAGYKGPIVIITGNSQQLIEWQEDFQSLLPKEKVFSLPAMDMVDFQTAARSMDIMSSRMNILGKLLQGEDIIVISSAYAAAQKGISSHDFCQLSFSLRLGDEIERNVLVQKIDALGYQRFEQVEAVGQYSIRGGIIDIYPINHNSPLRIEFFDNEIDSMRCFNPNTQLSIKNIVSAEILPVTMLDGSSKKEMFLSFVPSEANIILDEPLRIKEQLVKLVKENPEIKNKIVSWDKLQESTVGRNVFYTALLLQKVANVMPDIIINITVQAMTSYNRQLDILARDVKDYLVNHQTIIFFLQDKGRINILQSFFQEKGFDELNSDSVSILTGSLLNGFELPKAKISVITEKDIFGQQKRNSLRIKKDERISHFREIKEGDYVVHINHGIGKYMGVETMVLDGISRDYLHIKYGGEDKLFVPVEQVTKLQKYIGSEGETPQLNKLSGSRWHNQVAKAKKAVEDIAEELLKLYASRKKITGYAFAKDDFMQTEFEETFPYQETDDQLAAIHDVKKDMEAPFPMERLICGDVGFGKTEVAIRAAFKAVSCNKQVAVLVPTTVLAQQHFQTFTDRFHAFGVTVDVLNRFRSSKEQRKTLDLLKAGVVKIIIGTHAILNTKKVQFQDLGLLIVDEEQRFGVKQKEKIKQIATGVDVLTLSATPIPRTLHMSLAGSRDMSIIETAPISRLPVQSYVVEDDDIIITNAIRRELKRDGQIYFVHNRIENIEMVYRRLESLVPEARIQMAHGKMPEEMLERVMLEFYEKKYDILLSTSIIENGLDLPSANTIIINNADQFGLSQLYQMKGRVGRSDKLAYAYFVYQEHKVLTEQAERRLQAIKEFTELGAGFKIAMRDLEIRGAGNILGAQQHGHIASVGFEMYCQLLENAMQALKIGKISKIYPEPNIELKTDAYLDSKYISNQMHKIEIYQRILASRNKTDLNNILDDLYDRFGQPPEAAINLIRIAEIKNYARKLGMAQIRQKNNYLEITFLSSEEQNESGRTFNEENMFKLLDELGTKAHILSKEHILRIDLNAKQNVLKIVLRYLKILSGEQSPKAVKK